MIEFVKVQGTGNDFILLPDLNDELKLEASFVRVLCTRRLGLGADGVIRLGSGGEDFDLFMDYRNADGSQAEMCGNGVRCVAKWAADRGVVDGDVVRVGTRAGVKRVEITARHVDGRVAQARVDMGSPVELGPVPVDVGRGEPVTFTTLSMGNPHAVLVVDDVAGAPVAEWGPRVATADVFPQGTNVEFIAVPERTRVVGRVWERGVGETLASGTGSAAMAAAAHMLGLAERELTVELRGGTLAVTWTDQTLLVTGPAVEVASGNLDARWLADAAALEVLS